MVDVIKCCLDSIRQISDDIKDAVVYLDAGCTESFQFLGAFPLLLELGARAVCSLEKTSALDEVVSWQSNPEPAQKVVVITSRLLSDAHRYVLRCLSTLQRIHRCIIFTPISEVGHSAYPDSPLGPDAFREYESLLVQDYEELIKGGQMKSRESDDSNPRESLIPEGEGWSQLAFDGDDVSNSGPTSTAKVVYKDGFPVPAADGGRMLVVNVHHYPLILCPFSPRVFVLPSEGSVAEGNLSVEHENSISPGLPSISTGTPDDGEDVPAGATLTAQFLYHLATKMDLKLEIFSLGDLSKTVGRLLMDMSSLYDVGRRKRSAGLLLIDRTLDLLTPCCHGDSLVDRIFSCLPRREPTTSLTHMKGSQSQLKHGVVRPPLDVQIPLDKILEEETLGDNFQLLESIEAFLHGWDSSNAAAQIVDLTNLSKKLNGEKPLQNSKFEQIRGSFVSTDNFHETKYLEAILDRRTKDGAVLIKKWLQESLRQENITLNMKIRQRSISNTELQPMIKAIAKSQSSLVRNKGIIQLAAATVTALDELHSTRWDGFSSAEKILNVNAGDTSQSLASQISDLINKSALVGLQEHKSHSSQGLLSLQDALLLTVIGYILAGENFPTSGSGGPFSWQEEHFMQEAILDAILENPAVARLKFLQGLAEELKANFSRRNPDEKKEESPSQLETVDFDDDQWESWGDENEDTDKTKDQAYGDMQLKLELRDRVDNLFKFLHKLSSLRRIMPLETKLNDDPYSNKGLLYKVLTRVLAKYDVPGLEYHSSTVGRLFKSGFGRFGLGQAKPSLADQDIILVFVIGGINTVEVREAHEALSESSRPDKELILGGTTLLTPDDMFELLLGESSFI
ncbi:sec1 family domain-containing protein MIP3 isoform X1 [Coffea arabica]|uniref:Sec1 family domain-containing protein MIP3-like isoform X1 n=2 Tax=Coffea arabica TaxID=13443 RepID=A0A6P6SE78_COFAR|nr:sec1 family domain-containing protein MIP3-like isoform X1 [Coffea arabica]XP_027064099.1 sec1 family domain-containing protein MIP3-like isoform X1 [Coffea arabica]